MRTEDLLLVSVDDHIIEPPDLFVRHMSKEYLARAAQLARTAQGTDVWVFGGQEIENSALNAVAGRPKEEFGLEAQGLDEIRPGCFDHARTNAKENSSSSVANNRAANPGNDGKFIDANIPPASMSFTHSTNIDEWCGSHPGRFIPMALPVIWDADKCADEVRRVSAKGCHSLSFTENPAALGYPSFHSDYWDPLWRALCDTATVLSVHLGSSGKLAIPALDSPPDVMITLQPMNIQSAAADLLWSRVIKNFPEIKIALSEGARGGSRTSWSGSTARLTCMRPGRGRISGASGRRRCSGSFS